VLNQIQTLEPRGVGARSVEECLLLQLDDSDPHYVLKARLVSEHLDDLKKNRRPKISRSLGLSLRELDDLVSELASLDIAPGQSLADESVAYIYPDIMVEWTTEGYDVRLARQKRSLQLSPVFKTIYRSDEVDEEYKAEVRKRVESARWLISAIEQRQDTLLRVASRIVHYQRDFLDFGPHYLRPLKMQQVADDLGIHVSTVSRATHEKYIQTHRGIFSLKYFFSGATTNIDGGVESRTSVKQRVQEIIDGEDKQKPLSDERIVQRLRESFGVEVARRTVTKYRKALNIPSTRQRRVY
jgi:RNA polymerase sigma-54 factor